MNPLANESIGTKIKNTFKKSSVEIKPSGKVECDLVGMNRGVDICAKACACCWDKEIPDDFHGRLEYIAKRSRTGHTSILEHSNFVTYLCINDIYIGDLLQYLTWAEYLHSKVFKKNNGDWAVLLGGSYRGFSNVYLNTDDLNNPILKSVEGILYTYAPSGAFEDICKFGLMDKTRFMNVEPDENFKILTTHYEGDESENDMFDIIGLDDIGSLFRNLNSIDSEFAASLTTYDLLDFVTVSVMFKNMSRTCTHQLVRHRNGVTQESQRYVDYSDACFSSPALFKPDKYDPNHKYSIRFGPSANMNLTLDEIGDAICKIYGMLTNPVVTGGAYVLQKEDARAYLPGNVQCRKIYMTFTFKHLFKFMQLREATGAQAEIKMFTKSFAGWFRGHTSFSTKEITDTYTLPKLLIEDPFKIDVDEGIEETVTEITEEDYIKAAGLDETKDVETVSDKN